MSSLENKFGNRRVKQTEIWVSGVLVEHTSICGGKYWEFPSRGIDSY